MTDASEFEQRFGRLEAGFKNPDLGTAGGWALYASDTTVRRFDFGADGWAIDTKTRERAFRVDGDHRTFLPNGKEIQTPTPVVRPAQKSLEERLYGAPAKAAPRGGSKDDPLAAALYPSRKGR